MEKIGLSTLQGPEMNQPVEEKMDEFYDQMMRNNSEGIVRICADKILDLEKKGIKLESFLDYICSKYGYLMHGSITEIEDHCLKSQFGKVFASDRSAIAIMRSIYSNRNVNLQYPYYYDDDHPLKLVVHTPVDGKYISKDNGFIYLVKKDGFSNEPARSWQFVSNESEVSYLIVVETKKSDFSHPVEFRSDLDRS